MQLFSLSNKILFKEIPDPINPNQIVSEKLPIESSSQGNACLCMKDWTSLVIDIYLLKIRQFYFIASLENIKLVWAFCFGQISPPLFCSAQLYK